MSEAARAPGRSAVLTGGEETAGHVIPFGRAVFEVARKEVLVFARTKRLYIAGFFFAAGFLFLSLLFAYFLTDILGGGAQFLFGSDGIGLSQANAVMTLAIGFPVIGAFHFMNFLGIVFTFDSVVREYEDKSLFLILSKPISREAFVLGKFAGAVFAVAALFFGIATITYFLVMLMIGEFASLGDFGRFYLSILMLMMGMVALAAMAMFWSSVSRSTVTSAILSLLSWIVVLNILSQSGLMYAAFSQDITGSHPLVRATQYLNPSNSVGPSLLVMLNLAGRTDEIAFGLPFGGLDLDPIISQLSLLAFTAAFLFATIAVVNKRNFE